MRTLQNGLVTLVALGGLFGSMSVAAAPTKSDTQAESKRAPQVVRGAESFGPFESVSVDVDLRTLPAPKKWRPGDPIKVIPKRYKRAPKADRGQVPRQPGIDALAQIQHDYQTKNPVGGTRTISDPIINVPGPGFNGVFPPDTTGEVGINYYVHMINGGTDVLILNKSDGTQAAYFNLQALAPITSECSTGLGDPVVLYDELAGRWLFTEFSNAGNLMCVYLSKTGDPITGGWWFYELPGIDFPDYPKYGVWPDAYYVGSNESTSRMYAMDRVSMLSGGPSNWQRFNAPDLPGFGFQVLQPADLDGTTPPPAGAPGIFIRHLDDEWHGGTVDPSQDFVELWTIAVDFVTPGNSQLTGPINVGGFAEFDSELCDAAIFACFAQPSGPPLDPLREVVMQRLAYRNFSTHESMVGNFVVDIDGTNHGGIRWFELRRPNAVTPWTLYQEGTFATPLPDPDNRFMGSIAQDQDGNIALAYNVTSSVTFPAMRYTGRLATDPLGVMTQPEKSIIEGLGSNLLNRWGDYAAMSVDPVDGCTFWHTNMYGDPESWGTQIASFKFDECGVGAAPDFTLNGTNLNQSMCAPGDLDTIGVSVGSIAGFTDPVTLAFTNMPAGFSGVFSSTNVTPPGSSGADVLAGSVAAGDYIFNITGTAAGVGPKSLTANVTVTTAAPGTTSLTSPADGSPGEPANPALTWTAAADAVSYFIEVDNNSDFSSPEYTVTTGATAHVVVNALAPATYYWRVTPKNDCGDGTQSAIRSFTVSASLCASGVLIDNGTVVFPINVAGAGTITDLNVSLDIGHTYIGDLDISLTHVNTGTSVDLILSPGGGLCQGEDILVLLDDEAVAPVTGQCNVLFTPAIDGDFQPEVGSFLSDFDGEALAGSWTLTITDNVAQDTGSLREGCLIPEVQIPDTDGDGVTDDIDNCINTPNAGQEDVDGDGVGDVCDNCLLEANADQCNTNAGTDDFGNVCDADVDNNGIVNSFDVTILRANFGATGANDSDLDCNGIVNTFDTTLMRNDFGQAPGPTGIQ